MNAIEPACSEDRLALARRGALSASEWRDFATHLSSCADCRIAWRLSADFEGCAGARPGDERIVARAAKTAVAATARGRVPFARVAFAAAAVLLVAGLASGAMILRARNSTSISPGLEPTKKPRAKTTSVPKNQSATKAEGNAFAVPTPAPIDETQTPLKPDAIVPASARLHARGSERSPRHLAIAATPSLDIQPPPDQKPRGDGVHEAFSRAVAARQQGRLHDAIDAFRALQSRFPETPEALVAWVSLGDLHLRGGDAVAALAAFETYLRNSASGTLFPEALAGKARALAALGRKQESEALWSELARRFPGSPYARRAAASERHEVTP
jgi:TolA-binding protein